MAATAEAAGRFQRLSALRLGKQQRLPSLSLQLRVVFSYNDETKPGNHCSDIRSYFALFPLNMAGAAASMRPFIIQINSGSPPGFAQFPGKLEPADVDCYGNIERRLFVNFNRLSEV